MTWDEDTIKDDDIIGEAEVELGFLMEVGMCNRL